MRTNKNKEMIRKKLIERETGDPPEETDEKVEIDQLNQKYINKI